MTLTNARKSFANKSRKNRKSRKSSSTHQMNGGDSSGDLERLSKTNINQLKLVLKTKKDKMKILYFISSSPPGIQHEHALIVAKKLLEIEKELGYPKYNVPDSYDETSLLPPEPTKLIDLQEPDTGNTALIYASFFGNIGLIKLLLDNGAKVDTINHDGATALMVASRRDNRDIVRLLLEKGATRDIVDKYGKTAATLTTLKEIKNNLREYSPPSINTRARTLIGYRNPGIFGKSRKTRKN